MSAAQVLRSARRRAGLSQRGLAERSGIPQCTIARIESSATDPRVGTLSLLLRACGLELEARVRSGTGIDRAQIREMLALSPTQRVMQLSSGARFLQALDAAGKRLRSTQRAGLEPVAAERGT